MSSQTGTPQPQSPWAPFLTWLLSDAVQRTEFSSTPVPPTAIASLFSREEAEAVQVSYLNGRRARADPTVPAQPEIEPEDRSTKRNCLWQVFWHGFNEESRVRARFAPAPAAAPVATIRPPKVADPEFFTGERDKFEGFLSQLSLKFATDPTTFASSAARIAFAGSFLRGRAEEWFRPHVEPETGRISFASYEEFVAQFKAAFADPDAIATATRRLQALRQGSKSASAYHAEFASIMSRLKWDEKAQISTFRDGLRDEIKDLLIAREVPASFSEFVALIIKLDNAWHARQEEKKLSALRASGRTANNQGGSRSASSPSSGPAPAASAAPSTSSGTAPGPMELDAAGRGKLTRKERMRRRANNLCMFCGKAGHWLKDCPESTKKGGNKKGGGRQNASAATAAPAAPPAAAPAQVLYSTEESKN